MKICIVKRKLDHTHMSGLFPVYSRCREYYDKMSHNVIHTVEIRKPRNPKHHGLVFAMIRCLKANLPEKWERLEHSTEYDLLKAIMLDIGQVEIKLKLDGGVYYVPKSIAFENMDEDEFQPISDAISKLCAKILEVELDEFEKNYMEYL